MGRIGRKSQKVEALRQVPLFQGFAKRDLETLASHVDEVEVDAGTSLIEQGARGQQLLIIVEGSARVTRNGRKLADLGAGDVVGEMALIDNVESTATVVATEPCVLLAMHAKDFGQVLDTSPAFARKVMSALARRLREADRQLVG